MAECLASNSSSRSSVRPATLPGVPTSAIAAAVHRSIKGLRLLDHPYYRGWEEGTLQRQDLTSYAEQYRHFERCLPEVLSAGAAQMADGQPRRLVEANIEDELSNPRPHLDLFDEFASALGALSPEPTEATGALVGLYRDAAARGPVPLLAVVASYEIQGAEIAATKAAALSQHYDLDGAGIEFWTVHAAVEEQHADWTVGALESLQASSTEVEDWANRSAQAWWQFLDEREARRCSVCP